MDGSSKQSDFFIFTNTQSAKGLKSLSSPSKAMHSYGTSGKIRGERFFHGESFEGYY